MSAQEGTAAVLVQCSEGRALIMAATWAEAHNRQGYVRACMYSWLGGEVGVQTCE